MIFLICVIFMIKVTKVTQVPKKKGTSIGSA
jgi:hypothetical protein